jgi:ribA/ribD-fused uncharacterized protein
MTVERFVFFLDGPFSQWWESPFELDGARYLCAEQWMMAEKARLFGDEAKRVAILASPHPDEHQELGRRVAPFDDTVWKAAARDIVHRGNTAKFAQNPALAERLRATRGAALAFASPFDRLWGIGLLAADPRAQTRETWRGSNWLGGILTAVREELG